MQIDFGDGCTRSTVEYLFGPLEGWVLAFEGAGEEWDSCTLTDIVTDDDGDTKLVFARLGDDEVPTGEELSVSAWDGDFQIKVY